MLNRWPFCITSQLYIPTQDLKMGVKASVTSHVSVFAMTGDIELNVWQCGHPYEPEVPYHLPVVSQIYEIMA